MTAPTDSTPTDPRRRWCLGLLSLAIVGAALGGLLTWEHYEHPTLPGCGKDATFDCAAVNASEYSEIRGVPVAFLGLVGYVVTAVLAWMRLRKGPREGGPSVAYAFLFSVGAVAFSGFLFYVSKFVLKKLCLYCLALYGVNLGLLITSWGALGGPSALLPALKEDWDRQQAKRPLAYGLGLVVVALVLWAILRPGPFFNGPGETQIAGAGAKKEVAELAREEILEAPYLDPGAARAHAKGSSGAKLVIVEFSDFECPACKRASTVLAEFVKEHPGEVQLFYRHYPLDMACNPKITRPKHPNACLAAAAAEAAGRQEKFWPMHDLLFAAQPDVSRAKILEMAKSLALDLPRFEKDMADMDIAAKVADDVVIADQVGVASTPTLFVNGRMIAGGRPKEILSIWLSMAASGELDPPTARASATP